jgi:hypothetical protein|nr:MAG TPA: Protein of unknown function (DUF1514) [Bacteriophage sp.]
MFIITAVLFAIIILVAIIVPAIEDEIEYRRWLDENKERRK